MAAVLFTPEQTSVANLLALVDVAPDATVTKAIYESPGVRLVLFAMDAGQQLTDHSASKAAWSRCWTARSPSTSPARATRSRRMAGSPCPPVRFTPSTRSSRPGSC